MSVRILTGDCRDVLATLPAESVHCVVTSPPYWGLRDYDIGKDAHGLEPTIDLYVRNAVEIFRAVHRVLRPDGSLWLNLGDSYAGSWGAQGHRVTDSDDASWHGSQIKNHPKRSSQTGTIRDAGLKPKDLCGIPWRVAFALQADGWWLRQDIIWSKPNPMPESVTDRCTKAHEYLFLLTKSARYYFDAEAIKEESAPPAGGRQRMAAKADDRYVGADFKDYHGDRTNKFQAYQPSDRNKRSIWTVATSPFPEAHFATFPPELIEPCIKAGTSEKGCCAKCGAPWERMVGRNDVASESNEVIESDGVPGLREGTSGDRVRKLDGKNYQHVRGGTLGWRPTCKCGSWVGDKEWHSTHTVPCTVLDPFAGAGTTGLVADRLQRSAILIELNPTYAEMAQRRIAADAPLLQATE